MKRSACKIISSLQRLAFKSVLIINYIIMRFKILYFLPFVLAVFSGCLKTNNTVTPVLIPAGNFTGTFISLHLRSNTNIVDTARANLQLSLNSTTGFAVTGDTALVHAGSFGSYAVGNNGTMQFVDKTYPTTGTPAKVHLNGIYLYQYDGTTLQLGYISSLDTLRYFYNLKKQ